MEPSSAVTVEPMWLGHEPTGMAGLREQLVWAGVGLLCYLTAALVFLWVVFSAGVVESPSNLGSLTTGDGLWLFASLVLFAVGGYAMRRVQRARTARPDESALPPQYRSGPRPAESNATRGSRPSAEEAIDGASDPGTVRCPNCGAENDPEFTFCQECSEPLSE